ncbi:MAG: heavy metal translocating P-type ATPase metal-binding domain-containing protein, partial [Pseudomonadota bacterium]
MHCFHCEDEIPRGTEVNATINGKERDFCCIGCEAAAMFIEGAGLGNFYAHREQSEHAELRPGTIDYDVFDDPAVAAPYVRSDDDTQSATLYI